MYLFCISCKQIVATIKVPTLVCRMYFSSLVCLILTVVISPSDITLHCLLKIASEEKPQTAVQLICLLSVVT